MKLNFNLPLNSTSFGQTSVMILRTLFDEIKSNKYNDNDFSVSPLGQTDLRTQDLPQDFVLWLNRKIELFTENHDRRTPTFKLWHLNGGLDSVSEKQTLLSFYELDEPTRSEINAVKNNKTLFSSSFSIENFASKGASSSFLHLGFDDYNFKKTNKNYFGNERITFNLCGKFEKRKHHNKIIKAWIKKYGNNPRYSLQCAVYNPFLNEEQNQQILNHAVEGNKPFNVNFFPMMNENSVYNDYLNSADIIIGMSGGEGFGLPEFQSVAIGKHAVLLKAHAYEDWATDEMVTWVKPSGKIPVYDGMFFQPNQPYNQGNIYDFDEEDFITACEEAISKAEKNKVNEKGLELQTIFSKEKFLDNVLSLLA